ncbi:MAG: TonB-dependent receptor [Hyphomicrobium sp.]
MTTRQNNERRTSAVTAAVVGAVVVMAASASAGHAQSVTPAAQASPQVVAQAVDQLPPVIVQGATIDKPKIAPKPAATYSNDEDDAPAPKQAKPKAATKAAGGKASVPASAPAAAVMPQPESDATGSASADLSGGVPIDRIGSPVSVITGQQLRAQQIRHAGEALRSLPGVHVSQSGGTVQVRMRGAEGNHTLVLIDGIEANDTSIGEFNFADLLAEDIEQIEVIRGGQSGLYGSRAIGGVINITTKGGRGPLTFGLRTEGGSFRTRDVAGRVSAGNERLHFAASAQFRASDGYNFSPAGNEDDPYRHTSFAFKAGATVVEGVTVDMNLRRINKRTDYDNFDGPLGVAQTAVDAPLQSEQTTWLAGGKLNWDMLGGALSHTLTGNWNNGTLTSYDKTDPGIFDNSTYISERLRFGYQGTVRFTTTAGMRHAVSGLVENEAERFTPRVFFADSAERERSRLAYAAEYRGELFDRLFPTLSVRKEDNDKFEDFTTWKAAVSLKLPEIGMRPHASVGTAVALPGMFEQFGSILGTFVGNPNLTPEESFGWDAGVEFTMLAGKAVVDVTYFQTDLTNEITGFGNSLINLKGVSERKGVEVAGRVAVLPGVVVGASYTYLDATEPSGVAEIRRPRHAGRMDLNYGFDGGRGNLNVAAIYNGRSQDTTFFNQPFPVFFSSGRVTLDDYWLLNVSASYKVAPGVELYGRVENALDADYQEVFGYNTAGVTAFAGVRLTYEDPSTIAWSQRR